MTYDTAEYLPNHRPEKKFDIVKAKDPDLETILGARMDVLTDPELTDGARSLFCLLLDMSLDPAMNLWRRGEIAISNTQLRERLWRSSRAIYGWTKELESQRHIWVSKKRRPNTQPMNVFHITAMQPKKQQGPELPNDGCWGNGYRRPEMAMPKGARGHPCTKRHYLVDALGNPLFVHPVQNEPLSRTDYTCHPQVMRETPAQNDTCHPQVMRETPAELAGATRTKRHLPPAQNDTTPQQETAVSIETEIETERASKEIGEAFPPPGFKSWEEKLKKLYPRELEKLKSDLVKQRQAADPEDKAGLEDVVRRIQAIDEQLYGGKAPARAKPTRAARPVTAATAPKPLTAEEILDGARYLVENKKPHLLNEAQRQALHKAGEPFSPASCPKCNIQIANPDLLGNPGRCPHCNTILE